MPSPKATNAFGIVELNWSSLDHQCLVYSAHAPLMDNLPFYHCQLAMLAILLPQRNLYQAIFCLVGCSRIHCSFGLSGLWSFHSSYYCAEPWFLVTGRLFANGLIYLQIFISRKNRTLYGVRLPLVWMPSSFFWSTFWPEDYGFLRRPQSLETTVLSWTTSWSASWWWLVFAWSINVISTNTRWLKRLSFRVRNKKREEGRNHGTWDLFSPVIHIFPSQLGSGISYCRLLW